MPEVRLYNMCMVENLETGEVLVQDRVKKDWSGITFPGGRVEPGESLYASTVREIREETGLTVEKLRLRGLVDWENPDTGARWFIFLYKTTSYSGQLLEGTREGRVFWTPLSSLSRLPLAPNTDVCLRLLLEDAVSEAYGAWTDTLSSEFQWF